MDLGETERGTPLGRLIQHVGEMRAHRTCYWIGCVRGREANATTTISDLNEDDGEIPLDEEAYGRGGGRQEESHGKSGGLGGRGKGLRERGVLVA